MYLPKIGIATMKAFSERTRQRKEDFVDIE